MNILSSTSGIIVTEYNQVYFYSGDEFMGMTTEAALLNHSNGLLGAGQDNCLFLLLGVANGALHMTVDLHDTRPPVDDTWE